MRIIGIHDGHNSSVCLINDGEVVNYLQEERMVNEKNYFGFPVKSLEKILSMNNITYNDIDYFTFNGQHIGYPQNKSDLMKSYSDSYNFKSKTKYLIKKTPIYTHYKAKRRQNRKFPLTSNGVVDSKIIFVEHHSAHASAAYFGAPFINKEEDVLILTQDGAGDGLSGTVSIGKNGNIERIAEIAHEDSLGRIYATITFMLGMVPLEHEYKLMGMAPYAPDSGMVKSFEVFRNILKFYDQDGLIWRRNIKLPPMQQIYPYLREKLEFHRFDWIAAGLQKFTEDILTQWVKNAIKKTGIKNVVLSGGTFMNVKANQKISELPEVDNIFIFPSCGDESNALGSAWHVYYKKNSEAPRVGLKHLYLGDDLTNKDRCEQAIMKVQRENSYNISYEYHENIEKIVAELLANGNIVARCKGPMEFGARALGNRSILCMPSDLNKITVINNMIKKRDFWMPFAPVMLKERSNEYIKNTKNIDASYMMITFNATDKYHEFIGGVQQIDLTARPQVIDGTSNPEYYYILKHYESLTGKGVLINTSFNLHGLPIVHGPDEALYVFVNSGLKYVALGNYLVSK